MVTKQQLMAVAAVAAIAIVVVLVVYVAGNYVPNQLPRIPDQDAYTHQMALIGNIDLIVKIIVAIGVLGIVLLEIYEQIAITECFRRKKVGE